MKTTMIQVVALALVATLAACGDSGGDDSGLDGGA